MTGRTTATGTTDITPSLIRSPAWATTVTTRKKRTSKLAFTSDNTSVLSPAAFDAFLEAQAKQVHAPYGHDEFSENATALIREFFKFSGLPAYYMATGTASNVQPLAAICHAGSAILAASTAHILTDERGAVHAATGNAVFALPASRGLLNLEEIKAFFKRSDNHYSKPVVVTITQSTELGTVYKKEHYDLLRELKREFKFKIHLDGARFGNALLHLNAQPKDLSWCQDVDVMTLGFAKNGGGVGEAVVFFTEELAEKFDARQKQSQHLIAKHWMLTAPIVGLLKTGEYFRNAEHANRMALHLAAEIKAAYAELDGDQKIIAYPVEANAVFAKFSPGVLDGLRDRGWVIADFIGGCPRLVASWATTLADIEDFRHDLRETLEEESLKFGFSNAAAGAPARSR